MKWHRLVVVGATVLLLGSTFARAQMAPALSPDPTMEELNLKLQYGTTLTQLAQTQYQIKLDVETVRVLASQRDWWIDCAKHSECTTWAFSGSPVAQTTPQIPGNGERR